LYSFSFALLYTVIIIIHHYPCDYFHHFGCSDIKQVHPMHAPQCTYPQIVPLVRPPEMQDLPKNWLYLRTSCGGDPQQGWSNVEAHVEGFRGSQKWSMAEFGIETTTFEVRNHGIP
jgi:hypothetical protein